MKKKSTTCDCVIGTRQSHHLLIIIWTIFKVQTVPCDGFNFEHIFALNSLFSKPTKSSVTELLFYSVENMIVCLGILSCPVLCYAVLWWYSFFHAAPQKKTSKELNLKLIFAQILWWPREQLWYSFHSRNFQTTVEKKSRLFLQRQNKQAQLKMEKIKWNEENLISFYSM